MKIDLKKVLTVSERSGLYLFISESKSGQIVESLADKKRTFLTARVRSGSLADISIYNETGEVALQEVLERIKSLPPETVVPDAKSDPGLLKRFFEEVIPNYDRDRFYLSHMKKIVEWFHQLRDNDMLDFEQEEDEENDSN